MEVFGRSLSDFKKPLIIVVIVVFVSLSAVSVNLVLNLGNSVSPEPEAELEYNQFKVSNAGQNGTAVYMVKIEVEGLNRGWNDGGPSTDYLVVTKYNEEGEVGYATELSTELEKEKDAPNRPSQAGSLEDSNGGAVVANVGDVIYVTGVETGDLIQVFGGLSGNGQLIQTYEVK